MMQPPTFADVVAFHGHVCPGLAIGYRMTLAALAELASTRAQDEEIVAIVENDACGVDAVQVMSGCTFGKGNLLFHDHGKPVYTFFSRRTGAGVRVVGRAESLPASLRHDRPSAVAWILEAPVREIIDLQVVELPPPQRAEVRSSMICDRCREQVMDSRVQRCQGRTLCLPCWTRENGEDPDPFAPVASDR